ncbi:hypothetical protein Q4Q35_03535 [Flavivirga aquimarina]|uniref:DUF4071 domain-containing protein n=1 Tax=Flavivirga aquimarina TaxID=2027862 RepID=A0ABT8W6X5_9FLAO|nr:hypothetical protein [Flavivirga aquimarina]MDO5968869.1 hypothetical protein [Flavivirga aquimarina]
MPRRKKKSTVFVIMPFSENGTDEHSHFLSIYTDYIKPTIEESEGVALRGDDIIEPGSITIDLIEHLANTDIVIADLTNLNPNVLYELGIRHSLVSKGTILILDESKTPNIPFDLSNYRVIKYKGDPQGLTHLKSELGKYFKQIASSINKSKSDNPVHDWLGKKVKKKREITEDFSTFEKSKDLNQKNTKLDIEGIVNEALEEAESDMIPKKLIAEAEDAVRGDRLIEFLECVKVFINLNTFQPTDSEFKDMYYLATRIDAGNRVIRAILEFGREIFPESSTLITPFVTYLAHSTEKDDRQRAKKIVENFFRIKQENSKTIIKDISVLGKNTHLLAIMLDAYHRDGQHEQAYEITSSLVEQFPENTIALRNHARAMNKLGKFSLEEVLEAYKKAINVEFPGDYSALWYGAALEEAGCLIDALEAHVYACSLDLDEPECFARLAKIISDIVQPRNLWRVNEMHRETPDFIDRETVIKCIMLAIDCPSHGASQKFLCEQAMRNIGLGNEELENRLDEVGELTRTDRRTFIEPLYERLKSHITTNTFIK